jgi:hypothetical protein
VLIVFNFEQGIVVPVRAATVRGAAIDAAPRGNGAQRLTELKTSKFF